jgi:23S rRNA pseudouridine2605 synthase
MAKRKTTEAGPDAASEPGERLQKILAAAGLGSRRECEELIVTGRVEVDGRVADQLGTRVDPATQQIRVDGTPVRISRRVYFLVNKPAGVVTTNHDPSGRPRVIDLVQTDERVFAVGRLDRSSEGLILVTNDGELANHLTHPRYGVTKVYRVLVAGQPSAEVIQKLRKGVYLADGVAKVASIQVRRRELHSTELEIELKEGRNREIRRILARVGHKVMRLRRMSFGPLRVGTLPLGASRRLTGEEVRQLERVSRQAEGAEKARPKKARTRIPQKPAGGKPGLGLPATAQKRPGSRKPPSGRKPSAGSESSKGRETRFGSVIGDEFDNSASAPRPSGIKKAKRRNRP